MSAALQMDGFHPPTSSEVVVSLRPPRLSLPVGARRAFGMQDIGASGMLAGWAQCEAGHVWNDGPDATLLVATRRQPGPVELEIVVEPYVTRQNPAQEMTLFASGARVAFWRAASREILTLRAWIDPLWWRDAHDHAALRLVFHMPQSVSPFEIGDGDDMRQLGFSFRSIELKPSRQEI